MERYLRIAHEAALLCILALLEHSFTLIAVAADSLELAQLPLLVFALLEGLVVGVLHNALDFVVALSLNFFTRLVKLLLVSSDLVSEQLARSLFPLKKNLER
jgi:hypothetical protein